MLDHPHRLDAPTYAGTNRNDSRGGVSGWLVAILLVLIGVLLFRMSLEAVSNPSPIVARGDLAEDEKATIELYRQAAPSVVNVINLTLRQDRETFDITGVPTGSGSGFVWDREGHIITNFHVIEDAQELRVALGGDAVYPARVVGAAPDVDLAVLKIDAPRLKLNPIPRGESQNLVVGQKVFAIGNPFGLDRTLTTGVISGLGRQIEAANQRPIYDVIQTDAAINPGNSGGPLLDSAGLLIGINTAIYSKTGSSAGIGFAVPADTVNRYVPDLIRDGKVERAGLGIRLFATGQVQVLVEEEVFPRMGVLINDIVDGGAADEAGLRATRRRYDGSFLWGDLLLSIDGVRLDNNEVLLSHLHRKEVGDEVTLEYLRDGEQKTTTLTLRALPTATP